MGGLERRDEELRLAMAALSEPNRFRLVHLLREQPRAVGDLVDELGWPQPLVSHHLGVLSKAGLACVERDGRRRVYSVACPASPDLYRLMELVGLLGPATERTPHAGGLIAGRLNAGGLDAGGPDSGELEPTRTAEASTPLRSSDLEDYLL